MMFAKCGLKYQKTIVQKYLMKPPNHNPTIIIQTTYNSTVQINLRCSDVSNENRISIQLHTSITHVLGIALKSLLHMKQNFKN